MFARTSCGTVVVYNMASEEPGSFQNVSARTAKVLVLNTGGTIGMKKTKSGIVSIYICHSSCKNVRDLSFED